MYKELDLWRFAAERLARGEHVMLLVVAESSGSSPGRQGFKMGVGAGGELCGSIGGGVMEVNLVEQSRGMLAQAAQGETQGSVVRDQVHRRNAPDTSGMICSGKQTVIFKLLVPNDIRSVNKAIGSMETHRGDTLVLTHTAFDVLPRGTRRSDFTFEKFSDTEFEFTETLGPKNDLYIIGGGHCSLALSELMSRLDFYIHVIDDRKNLNTLESNRFADEISIVDDYNNLSDRVPAASNAYVVVMTLGYASDESAIRGLVENNYKYFGVMGSAAKMKTVLRNLASSGISAERLARLRAPVGLSINSRTPDEIAVSIAAEIIAVKNA